MNKPTPKLTWVQWDNLVKDAISSPEFESEEFQQSIDEYFAILKSDVRGLAKDHGPKTPNTGKYSFD